MRSLLWSRKGVLAMGFIAGLWSSNAYSQRAPINVCLPDQTAVDSCTDTPSAAAVSGRATNSGIGVSGRGDIGVEGISGSATGAAGSFANLGGGDIIRGIGTNNRDVFRVDNNGNIFVRGHQFTGPQGPPGAQGPPGPQGAPGPATRTVAICGRGCGCPQGTAVGNLVNAPCNVTSDTGTCSQPPSDPHTIGCCVVCRPTP